MDSERELGIRHGIPQPWQQHSLPVPPRRSKKESRIPSTTSPSKHPGPIPASLLSAYSLPRQGGPGRVAPEGGMGGKDPAKGSPKGKGVPKGKTAQVFSFEQTSMRLQAIGDFAQRDPNAVRSGAAGIRNGSATAGFRGNRNTKSRRSRKQIRIAARNVLRGGARRQAPSKIVFGGWEALPTCQRHFFCAGQRGHRWLTVLFCGSEELPPWFGEFFRWLEKLPPLVGGFFRWLEKLPPWLGRLFGGLAVLPLHRGEFF